jgi:phosphatidylglycerol---prolipoprotein diacylglyceryl transferase
MTEAQLLQILRAGHPFVYTGFVAAGAAAGGALIRRDARDWAVTPLQRGAIIATVFVGGLVGSALPAFLSGGLIQQQAERYAIGPKTILGGLIAGFLAVAVLKRLLGIAAETSDAFARGTCVMMAIGRLGCYAAHCCVGVASGAAWAQDFGDGVPRLPIQLLEAAVLAALFVLLQVLHTRHALTDRRLFLFFAAYGTVRFLLERWREPIATTSAGIGFYQWLALLLAGIGVYQLSKRTRIRATPSFPLPERA